MQLCRRLSGRIGRVSACAALIGTVIAAYSLDRCVASYDRLVASRLREIRSQQVSITCADCTGTLNLHLEGSQLQAWVPIGAIPKHVISAVVAIEDHRFFGHPGVDVVRTARAVADGFVHRRRPRGTSTITQQVARLLFLHHERTWGRKWRETMLASRLERQLSKAEILEIYLNMVPLGRVGPYPIRGVQQGAAAYFNKELSEVNLAEAALLAAMIQRPAYLNPRTHPEPALARRNLVLRVMARRGVAGKAESSEAARLPMRFLQARQDLAWAGHYTQLASKELASVVSSGKALAVEVTLDAELQKAAVNAVREGLAELDKKKGRKKHTGGQSPEAALVAIDARTGAVRALAGGRDFFKSQLNRAVALRQPGSAFKPFVFASALEFGTAAGAVAPDSLIDDSPREFMFRGETYMPANYGGFTESLVTLQDALNRSLNVPAVRLAEAVGYKRVAGLARRAGIENVQPTPAMALGAYEVSPLALAGAYSIFANQGRAITPYFIERVRTFGGALLYESAHEAKQVIRPATAARMTQMLAGVVNSGTAYPVRALGFWLPAAGKTGTDDDGWFAGYTTRLICVVWTGYDDNSNLGVHGADSALPIWTSFMKRAHQLPAYRDAGAFPPAPALTSGYVDIDP